MHNIKQLVILVLVSFALTGCNCKKKLSTTQIDSIERAYSNISIDEEFKKLVQHKVFFAFDKFSLSKEAKQILLQQVEWLKNNQNTTVNIEGHCDEIGTDLYNYHLGLKRTQSVKDFLVNHGIDQNRLGVISYGKSRPDETGHNKYAHRANRRAVTIIIK